MELNPLFKGNFMWDSAFLKLGHLLKLVSKLLVKKWAKNTFVLRENGLFFSMCFSVPFATRKVVFVDFPRKFYLLFGAKYSRVDQVKSVEEPSFFYQGFISRTFTNHRLQGKGEGISLTPHYHFHPLHTHWDISREITAESSRLSSRLFPSASC